MVVYGVGTEPRWPNEMVEDELYLSVSVVEDSVPNISKSFIQRDLLTTWVFV